MRRNDIGLLFLEVFFFLQGGLLATGEWDPQFDRMGAFEGVFSGKVGVLLEG